MNSFARPEILAIEGYTPGEQPQQGGFVKLNTNENPYPPSPRVREAILQALDRLPLYPDPMAQSFRQAAADLLGVEPDWILCGNGSDDILTILTRTCVGQGQWVRYPHPSYVLYRTLAQLQGAYFEEVPFRPDWTLPEEFTEPRAGLRLVYLANPNSPSGTVLSPQQVSELARRLPCPLLIDEAYADFAETNCLDLVREHENVLVSRSMSKSYALAGLRFGFVVAQPRLIAQLAKVKDSYNCDALSIAGATAAIRDQAWLQQTRSRILATRRRMAERLKELGFEVTPSQANFLWCHHPEHAARRLYEELKRARILVRYLEYRGWPPGLRITVGTDAQVDQCLDHLARLV